MATATGRSPRSIRCSPARLKRYFEDKLAAELGPHNVKRLMDEGARNILILDVRSTEGYNAGHLPGASNIPFEQLPHRLRELSKSKEIITYCWNVTCLLCTKAAHVLASKGYAAREMIGGIQSWKEAGFPIEQ